MPIKMRPGYRWRVRYLRGDDPTPQEVLVLGAVAVEGAAEQARDTIREGNPLDQDFTIIAVERSDHAVSGRRAK